MTSFSPGDRVGFRTVAGDMTGTVEACHGDDVYSVRSEDGEFPVLLLLGRHLQTMADEPLVVHGVAAQMKGRRWNAE